MMQNSLQHPHQGQPVYAAGEPLERAAAAMLMLHGRGAGAQDILSLAAEVNRPGFAFLAPHVFLREHAAMADPALIERAHTNAHARTPATACSALTTPSS